MPDEEPPERLQRGSVQIDYDEDAISNVAAVLWLPDPESQHWWREFYVKKRVPKPGGKGMGFR
jgi:hypothetical protein